jgi:hypothetical protein
MKRAIRVGPCATYQYPGHNVQPPFIERIALKCSVLRNSPPRHEGKTNINDDADSSSVPPEYIPAIRADIERFKGELEEEGYRNWAGLKDEMNTAVIYDRHAHLFSLDVIQAVKTALDTGPGAEDGRCLRYLRTFSTLGYLDNAVRSLSDRIGTFEAQTIVELGEEKIPYRTVPVLVMNERDDARRKALFEARLGQTEKLNVILLERMTNMQDKSTALGFRNYADMCSSLKSIDYIALDSMMEEMLRRTETLYIERMDDYLKKKVGMPLTDAWSYDVAHALRAHEFDSLFPKDRMVGAFRSTLNGMGIDPDQYPNIAIDMEDRPGKSPRAFCAVVNVPRDIRLVIRPTGGYDDYEALFHEGGHSWHFGSTNAEHPPEYRYLGDNSVTEAFAFLFEYLAANKLWLSKVQGVEDAEEYLRFAALTKLHFLRRYAAKLAYELKLHNGKANPDFQLVYKNSLQKALRYRHSEKRFLEDVDDSFYCAEYLRAWILEAQLRSALEDQFGEEWFANEKTGPYLKELWSHGQKYTADELVKMIGYVDLDIEHLISEIERGLAL